MISNEQMPLPLAALLLLCEGQQPALLRWLSLLQFAHRLAASWLQKAERAVYEYFIRGYAMEFDHRLWRESKFPDAKKGFKPGIV